MMLKRPTGEGYGVKREGVPVRERRGKSKSREVVNGNNMSIISMKLLSPVLLLLLLYNILYKYIYTCIYVYSIHVRGE